MLNIIFDGNYLLHTTMYVYRQPHQRGDVMFDTRDDMDLFIRKFMTDFGSLIRKVNGHKRVIITWDSHSWRKKIKIDQNSGYKANRKKESSNVNWDNFNILQKEITEILSNHKFIVSKINNAEGDDLIFLWSKYLLAQNENCIILSGDRDLTQLVKINENNNYCVVYDNRSIKRILFAPIGLKKILENNDDDVINILDMSFMSSENNGILKLLENSLYSEVDPEIIIWTKVIAGDSSDNIPSIWSWEKKSKDKTKCFNVSEKKASQIKEDIISHFGEFKMDDMSDYIPDIVYGIKMYHKQDADETTIKERIERNKTLVILSTETIPQQIQDDFKEKLVLYEQIGIPTLNTFTIKSLLEGTPYFTDISFQSDFFSNHEKSIKKKKKNNSNIIF